MDIHEYDHDMMIMHMLHNGHGHGVALFGREINICNTVITPFTGEGRVHVKQCMLPFRRRVTFPVTVHVTANTIDWFIVVTCTHILYVHVQS